MKCNYPMTRIETWDGKISFERPEIKDGEIIKDFAKKYENAKNIKKINLIPCGQCISCRLNRSKEWATRLMCEAKEYKNNYFITLTYADEYLPIKRVLNYETGEIKTGFTLKKEDLEKFNHDLRQTWQRKYNHSGIRYYECGEYGTENERPHYHCIIFNLPFLSDLNLYRVTETGDNLYTSETISRIWKKGYVIIGEVTFESAAYVARYVMKKKFGKEANEYYKSKAKIPEFTTMSRMPGIGYNYYEANKEKIYENDEIWIQGRKGIQKQKPGKYFDKLLEKENPEKLKEIKRKRNKASLLNSKLMLDKISVTNNIQKQREISGRNTEQKIKALKREL